MKKYLLTIVIVLSMLVMIVGTAAAAPQAAGTASLVSVEYVPGKGPVFTFSVEGKFSKAELKGSVQAPAGDFGLHCSQSGDTVRCTTSKKVAGQNVVVSWGGGTFWAQVPEVADFCYGVYDWSEDVDAWARYGSHCQDGRASYGDLIEWVTPAWGPAPYLFLPESPLCSWPNVFGDAYYFPACPEDL